MRWVDGLLALAVAAAGAHVLLSMQLPVAALLFAVLAVPLALAGRLLPGRLLAPTPGLAFIVFVSGGLLGYMALVDLVPAASWAVDFSVFAGLLLAGLLLMVWLLASRPPPGVGRAGDPPGDTLALAALALALLIPRPLPTGMLAQLLPWLAAGCAVLSPSLARLGSRGMWRVACLLPVAVLLPLSHAALQAARRPVLGAVISALPAPRGATGFSPLARLRAEGLLRPARRPVLRVWVADGRPPPYLVGNRLLTLDAQYEWKTPGAAPLTEPRQTDDGRQRFRLAAGTTAWTLAVHSLRRDDLLFVPPGTRWVEVADGGLGIDAAGVLDGKFAGRDERRWRAAGGGLPVSPVAEPATLALPVFWDAELQTAARRLGGSDAAHTAARIGAELRSRRYSLDYRLDRRAPLKDFFLNRQPAHCFWYATAATLALRANGVPSRLVTGYRVSEALGEDLFLVRERDAHAWTEWQDGAGRWHTLDATPPDYGAVLAPYGGGWLERAWQRVRARLDAWWQQVELSDAQVQAVLLAGLAVLAVLFVREYRRLRRVDPRQRHSRQWLRLWRGFLRTSGLPERPQWTAADYRANLPPQWPSARLAAARRFLDSYAAARFAPDADTAAAAAALRELRRRRLSGRGASDTF